MIGVYVHIPFCEKKCRYCDFYSIANDKRTNEFIDALCKEIELFSDSIGETHKVNTIFFGGGTPSKLSAAQLEKILNHLAKYFDLSCLVEFTLECNPGTDFLNKLSDYKKLMINRLSIGVQSFVDPELRFLDRIHDAEEAYISIQKALEFGYENLSADIIFSIPGQTHITLNYTLEKLLELGIPHISAYSLIYEEGTPLFNELKQGKIQPVAEDLDFQFFDLIHRTFFDAGYEHYEVSNFARNNMYCKHNLRYWKREEYIGFGPSAHSFVGGRRFWNIRSLNKYIDFVSNNKLPIENWEELSFEQQITESIMLGLRASGIDFEAFQNQFGIDLIQLVDDIFAQWEEKELATKKQNRIKLTHHGYFVCDSLTLELINRLKI